MERFTVTGLTNLTTADHAGRLEAFLQAHGIQTNGVGIRWDELGRPFVTVRADRDPADVLSQYTTTPTTEEVERDRRLSDARTVIQAIAAKPRADRTPVERALLGLSLAVRELTD